MIALLVSPLGRYAAAGLLVVMLAGGAYLKIRASAFAEIEAAATSDTLKRTQDALGTADRLDLSPDRLRAHDGNERQ